MTRSMSMSIYNTLTCSGLVMAPRVNPMAPSRESWVNPVYMYISLSVCLSIHICFIYIYLSIYTLSFSSVAMRLGPVPAGPVHSCVGAAGRFAAVCCVRGGVYRGIKSSSSSSISPLFSLARR